MMKITTVVMKLPHLVTLPWLICNGLRTRNTNEFLCDLNYVELSPARLPTFILTSKTH